MGEAEAYRPELLCDVTVYGMLMDEVGDACGGQAGSGVRRQTWSQTTVMD